MDRIDFPVVGIGASAGGLKALQEFFDHIPEDCGIAFVVIVHLAPQRTSAMESLLSSHTSMKVDQVSEKTEIKPNYIYIIPPDKQLEVTDGELQLKKVKGQPKAVIDIFFRSLAKKIEKQAIGIIMSGTGSDGTIGLKAVKEYGGVTMVQDPMEAEYDGMPRSAIETDIVDFVMPVQGLAQKVMDHKEFLGKVKIPLHTKELSDKEDLALKEIFELLISKKGYDFNNYKRSSVLRRLQRRMQVTGSETIYDYRSYLDDHGNELDELFKDLLISVTNFFRDPEAFENLEKEVIPKLFEGKDANDQIRVWSIGCATGEELYSLAILLYEYASKLDYLPQIKIFGTDISQEALQVARRGFYPHSIAADISEERLKVFFQEEDSGYRVRREIREMVLVSKHNVISDPPFTNLDLIACRNLLIYFNPDLQKKVLRVLQYSLKTNGYLFLGMSESAVGAEDLFEPLENTKAIYKSKQLLSRRRDLPRFLLWQNMRKLKGINKEQIGVETSFEEIHKALLAEQYGPASVIVNDDNEVMHFSRGVSKYLEYEEGEPTSDLIKLARAELQRALRSALYRFDQLSEPDQIVQQVRVEMDGESHRIIIRVNPIIRPNFPSGYRQVIFEELEEPPSEKGEPLEKPAVTESKIVEQLESELDQTKEQLQQTIEEYETSNEELMASNEELQSMNEELQTATEELETSQEELQSVNEELRTVNQELENKIEELEQANNDLKNLMEATEIAMIFVDRNMKIVRFTGKAEGIFNFIKSDIGRPLTDVRNELQYDKLANDIRKILEGSENIEKQLITDGGKWYNMSIKPNLPSKNQVEGVVLTFVDITNLKEAERELEEKIEIQKQLQQDILRVEKKERWSIGQFLHDELSQNLLAAKTLLDSRNPEKQKLDKELEKELEDIQGLIVDSLEKIRELSHFILPLNEDVGTVLEALELLASQTENVYEIECTVNSDERSSQIEDQALSSSLYYIAQEAVSNAIKHGKASKVEFDLSANKGTLNLTIKDNGKGYDEEDAGNGEGINIMKYRAELLNGSLEVEGLPKNKGTVVKCSIPLEEAKKIAGSKS